MNNKCKAAIDATKALEKFIGDSFHELRSRCSDADFLLAKKEYEAAEKQFASGFDAAV